MQKVEPDSTKQATEIVFNILYIIYAKSKL